MAERASFERSSTEIPASPVAPAGHSPDVGIATVEHEASNSLFNDLSAAYDTVVRSEIGVNTLLARLKQSIASARDFAAFLKKRSSIEEEHAQALKKLCRSISESARRPDHRQGSFGRNYGDMSSIHDRTADNGVQFALSLHQMHEDLQELAAEKERKRKEWKQKGLSAEKRVQDADTAMEKAKVKYNSLAEDYDRARTGDKQPGRFGLKGPKSAAQVEEDLHRKMQAADSDYSGKVQTTHALRQELINTLRPQAVQAIEQLINECDSGITLQMQKYATFNEKLLLSNGLCISPIKAPEASQRSQTRSLRDVIREIDNEMDLRSYVSDFASRVGPRHADSRYESYPTTHSQIAAQPSVQHSSQLQGTSHLASHNLQRDQFSSAQRSPSPQAQESSNIPPQFALTSDGIQTSPSTAHPTLSSPYQDPYQQSLAQHAISNNPPPIHPSQQAPFNSHMAAQLPTSQPPHPQSSAIQQQPLSGSPIAASKQPGFGEIATSPSRPVFGISLDELFSRDGSAVPMVVYQCLQAVDLFGLDVEGIYRLSGNASHITKLRTIFDHDASSVDFRNPENFYHDVNSVAGLLKQFFRDLPDPLLTREHYQSLIDAARIDDEVARRDSLHAEINTLPDPNYATLRALTLHLHRVQEHSDNNRMNAGNLAICFGPTLMIGGGIPAIADAGWQVRAVDTILQYAFSIFDED